MPTNSRKRSDVRTYLGRLTGALVRESTATSTAADGLTLTDTKAVSASTTYFDNKTLIARPGLSTQETVYLAAFTPGSDQWAIEPALSTLFSSADAYQVWDESILTLKQAEAAIDLALGKLFHQAGLPIWDDELTVGDILAGAGQFERFGSGVPVGDGAKTGAGTLAQLDSQTDGNEHLVQRGRYSMSLANTADNALAWTWKLPRPEQYAGMQMKARAWLWSQTASRLRLRLEDGVTTWNSDYATANSRWEAIEIDQTLSASLTKLDLSVRSETGGAITVYADNVRLLPGHEVRSYDIGASIDRLSEVRVGFQEQDDTTRGEPWYTSSGLVMPSDYSIQRGGATPRLHFKSGLGLPQDHPILLVGQQVPALWTDDTTTVSMSDEQYIGLTRVAVYEALLMRPVTTEQDSQRLAFWQAEANLWLSRADTRQADEQRLR